MKFIWNEVCEYAFQKLKKRLTYAPILIVPERGAGYTIYYDASREGMGCVLMQNDQVVAYWSLQFKVREKNYPTHDLQLEAAVISLKLEALSLWREI